MTYEAALQHVYNRGRPPETFLDQLRAWGLNAPEEICAPNPYSDIYSATKAWLGPWRDNYHRRAVMLEVMRVLGGFESSWNWQEGRDTTNAQSITPMTIEAGLWQVSGDAMEYGDELKSLVMSHVGSLDGSQFQNVDSVYPWLRRDAVEELMHLMSKG